MGVASCWLASASTRRDAWLRARTQGVDAWWLAGGVSADEDGQEGPVSEQVLRALGAKLDTLSADRAWLERPQVMLEGADEWSWLGAASPGTPAWSPMGGRACLLADTLVEHPDDDATSLGQPADADAARRMLTTLAGRSHRVWSATAILWFAGPFGGLPSADDPLDPAEATAAGLTEDRWSFPAGWRLDLWRASATVDMSGLDPAGIEALVASGSWKGKAGGYDLDGEAGEHIAGVDGPDLAVIGLADGAVRTLLPWLRQG